MPTGNIGLASPSAISRSAPAQPTTASPAPVAPASLDAVKRVLPGSSTPVSGSPSVVRRTVPTQLEELTVHVAIGTADPSAYALTVIAF